MCNISEKINQLSFGDILVFDNLIFDDGTEYFNDKIPCVFLCKKDDYVYAMKLSGNNRKYRTKREKYMKLNEIYKIDFRTLNLVNINNVIEKKEKHIYNILCSLKEDDSNNLEDKIESLAKKGKIYKLISDILKSEEELEDKKSKITESNIHILGMKDLFPNGTGRTKEEFEKDNKDIYKKFTLEYYDTINRHQ